MSEPARHNAGTSPAIMRILRKQRSGFELPFTEIVSPGYEKAILAYYQAAADASQGNNILDRMRERLLYTPVPVKEAGSQNIPKPLSTDYPLDDVKRYSAEVVSMSRLKRSYNVPRSYGKKGDDPDELIRQCTELLAQQKVSQWETTSLDTPQEPEHARQVVEQAQHTRPPLPAVETQQQLGASLTMSSKRLYEPSPPAPVPVPNKRRRVHRAATPAPSAYVREQRTHTTHILNPSLFRPYSADAGAETGVHRKPRTPRTSFGMANTPQDTGYTRTAYFPTLVERSPSLPRPSAFHKPRRDTPAPVASAAGTSYLSYASQTSTPDRRSTRDLPRVTTPTSPVPYRRLPAPVVARSESSQVPLVTEDDDRATFPDDFDDQPSPFAPTNFTADQHQSDDYWEPSDDVAPDGYEDSTQLSETEEIGVQEVETASVAGNDDHHPIHSVEDVFDKHMRDLYQRPFTAPDRNIRSSEHALLFADNVEESDEENAIPLVNTSQRLRSRQPVSEQPAQLMDLARAVKPTQAGKQATKRVGKRKKRGPVPKQRVIHSLARFLFVPNEEDEQLGSLKPLEELPADTQNRLITAIENLWGYSQDHFKKAATMTDPVNHARYVEQKKCMSHHIIWKNSDRKGKDNPEWNLKQACTGCSNVKLRPCVKLEWHPDKTEEDQSDAILVIYPRSETRRPKDATWETIDFWLC